MELDDNQTTSPLYMNNFGAGKEEDRWYLYEKMLWERSVG